MNRDPAAASHLADLDARFEDHLSALQQRSAESGERLAQHAARVSELAAAAAPPDPQPFPAGPTNPDSK